jgi:hypothetical protein
MAGPSLAVTVFALARTESSRHPPLHSFVWPDTDGITQKV